MLTRRCLLAEVLRSSPRCHAVCDFDGVLLTQPARCAPRPPGSTVKPLVAALIDARSRYRCEREVGVAHRRLDCVHRPLQGALDLETAIAASCNSWFVQASRRIDPTAVKRLIDEAGGETTPPKTADDLALLMVGVEGVRFTPAALAKAYSRLRTSASPAVIKGLAAAARDPVLAGKTGTVRDGGWFAGWTHALVVAVFVSGGKGAADAAPAAREIVTRWRSRHF